MADCEGSSSDDDEDYLPDENVSEDDSGDGDSACKKSTTTASNSSRVSGTNRKEWEEEEMLMKQRKEEAAKKAREEGIWTSFKKDTSFKPALKSTSSKTLPSSSDSKMSITRTYDFAGEAIRVTKTVDLGSEEAKNVKRDEGVKKNETTSLLKPVGISGIKRSGGLTSVLGKISKKPKMSTLEKSKLDWETFKDQEGIEDELRNFNKDGYLEKQAFLQRADERQFEIEKDMRKGTRRK